MMEGRLRKGLRQGLPIVVERGVIVPGNHIQVRCQLAVVQPAEHLHEIRRHRYVRRHAAQRIYLKLHKVIRNIGGKPPPLQIQPHDAGLPVGKGRLDLLEAVVMMAPEGGPPGLVQLPDIMTKLLRQIFPEPLDTAGAITLSPELIGNMVHNDPRMRAEALCKLPVNGSHLGAVGKGAHAVVVAHAMVIAHSPVIHPHGLRVLLVQPGRTRPRGRGQHRVNAVFIQIVYNPLHPPKVELPLHRLISRPGEHPQGHAVDARLFHQAHILLQYVRPVQPLVRIVIPAVYKAA